MTTALNKHGEHVIPWKEESRVLTIPCERLMSAFRPAFLVHCFQIILVSRIRRSALALRQAIIALARANGTKEALTSSLPGSESTAAAAKSQATSGRCKLGGSGTEFMVPSMWEILLQIPLRICCRGKG